MTAARAVVAVLAVGLIAPSRVSAAPWAPKKRAARDLLNSAADAAEAGDFTRSAALSLQSLTVEPSIFALWNAGQAFMDAGEWARALEQYELALADADLPRKQRPRIEARRSLARAFVDADTGATAERWDEARAAYLAILDRDDLSALDRQHAGTALEQLAQRRAAAATAAQAARDPSPRGSTAAAPSSPTMKTSPTSPVDLTAPARPSRWSDTSALAILGTGAIGVALGGWFVMRAEDLDDQAAAPESPEPDRNRLHDRADRSRTGATIAFAAGGALVLAGAIKLAIPPRPSHATLQPTAGGVLVVVGGRF